MNVNVIQTGAEVAMHAEVEPLTIVLIPEAICTLGGGYISLARSYHLSFLIYCIIETCPDSNPRGETAGDKELGSHLKPAFAKRSFRFVSFSDMASSQLASTASRSFRRSSHASKSPSVYLPFTGL